MSPPSCCRGILDLFGEAVRDAQGARALVRQGALDRALAEAQTIPDLKTLHDELAALHGLAKRMRLSLVDQNRIVEYRIHVARKAGSILASTVKRGGDAMAGTSAPLPDGITWSQSSRWQKAAKVERSLLREYLEAALEHDEEVTMAGLIRASVNGVHFRSDSVEWCTPAEIVNAVVEVLGVIELDPCSNGHTHPNVPAKQHFTREDDGLAREWAGAVFMSPPYGSSLPFWTAKLLDEFEAGRTTEAVALLQSRTDTAWFESLREFPRCFLRGRLRFNNHENSAPFPSMALYLGANTSRFARVFEPLGDLYVLYVRAGA